MVGVFSDLANECFQVMGQGGTIAHRSAWEGALASVNRYELFEGSGGGDLGGAGFVRSFGSAADGRDERGDEEGAYDF